MRTFSLLLALALSGCMLGNLTQSEKLREAVNGYNEEVRWTRLDLALQRVAPAHRAAFRAHHLGWGRDIQLADVEVMSMRVAGEEAENATSTVTYRWYDQRQMLVAETMLLQTWERTRGNFYLTNEEHLEGDPGLLRALPDPTEPDATEPNATEPDAAAPEDASAATEDPTPSS
ncbi:MAG: hypothetical protein AAF447_20765 [Myxococcota bacterium]